MIRKEDRAKVFAAASQDTTGSARIELFRALEGEKLYYIATVREVDGQELIFTELRRLDDDSSAFVVYTSKYHPDLPNKFYATEWTKVLEKAYDTLRADWLVIANRKNRTVAVSRDQIPVILADLALPPDERPPVPTANIDELEAVISGSVNASAADWHEPALAQLRGREIYLHITGPSDHAGQPSVLTSPAAGRPGWVLAYTTRHRPGIRYGGIRWEDLVDMVDNNGEMAGVRVVNAADDWILLDRDSI